MPAPIVDNDGRKIDHYFEEDIVSDGDDVELEDPRNHDSYPVVREPARNEINDLF